jgi:hypothetical protein
LSPPLCFPVSGKQRGGGKVGKGKQRGGDKVGKAERRGQKKKREREEVSTLVKDQENMKVGGGPTTVVTRTEGREAVRS